MFLVGWGITENSNRNLSQVLMKAEVEVLEDKECDDYYDDTNLDPGKNSYFCTSGFSGKGICEVGSMNALFLNIKNF